MKAKLNESNEKLIDVNKDNSVLKTLVSQLKQKCRQTEEAFNDSELQSLRFSQQNDLVFNSMFQIVFNSIILKKFKF